MEVHGGSTEVPPSLPRRSMEVHGGPTVVSALPRELQECLACGVALRAAPRPRQKMRRSGGPAVGRMVPPQVATVLALLRAKGTVAAPLLRHRFCDPGKGLGALR